MAIEENASLNNDPSTFNKKAMKDIQSTLQKNITRHKRVSLIFMCASFLFSSAVIAGYLYLSASQSDLERAYSDWKAERDELKENYEHAHKNYLNAVAIEKELISRFENCETISDAYLLEPVLEAQKNSWIFQYTREPLSSLLKTSFEIEETSTTQVKVHTCIAFDKLKQVGSLNLSNLDQARYEKIYTQHASTKNSAQMIKYYDYEGTVAYALKKNWYTITIRLAENESASIQKLNEFDTKFFNNVQKLITRIEKNEKSTGEIVEGITLRIGAVSLSLYFVALFIGFGRYHSKLVTYYEGRLIAFLNATVNNPTGTKQLPFIMEPETINFGKEPELPTAKLIKLAKIIKS